MTAGIPFVPMCPFLGEDWKNGIGGPPPLPLKLGGMLEPNGFTTLERDMLEKKEASQGPNDQGRLWF